jgi:glycosyltransferase involved in cell wall biosynthesis
MPAVVIEAGIAGLPVAGFALSGVPEVVVDGSTGLLAAPGDHGALAECATRLLADPGLRDRMGRAAHERCSAEFSIAAVAPRYLDVYRALASAGTVRAASAGR